MVGYTGAGKLEEFPGGALEGAGVGDVFIWIPFGFGVPTYGVLTLRGMELGSWTELVVGVGSIVVAAVLGGLALGQAKQATKWAEKSADLQRRANELAEAALPVRFIVKMGPVVYHEGDEPGHPFDAWLHLKSEEGSASVLIHQVETKGAYFGPFHFPDLIGNRQIEPLNELPERLHVGGRMTFRNPWSSYSPELTQDSWARVRISFSATSESPIRKVEVDVCLDGVRPEDPV